MSSKYDVAGIINFLQEQPDINPDDYDGSYELLRETVRSYATLRDYATIDYLDLNALYLMVIGTWKHGIERKKETINSCHLPESEKVRLLSVIDKIWTRVCANGYSHQEDSSQPQMGMFGTGFYTFKGKTTDQCAKDFVRMCVDVLALEDEDAIFDRVEQVLAHDFRGMKAASASVVLHCLNPDVFPILNGNMGTDNIFEAAGVKLKKRTEVSTYIVNCRAIRAFRDKNFDFRNYRVFDVAQWKLDKFLIGGPSVAHIDIAKLQAEIAAYKKDFQRVINDENYKWEAVKCFKDNFRIDAEDFPSMLERALEKSDNLLSRMNYYAKGVILEIAHYDPEYTRTMFQNLFDESEPVLNRMKQFEDDAEIYFTFGKGQNTYQGANTTSVYLFFNDPEKYYIYLSMKFEYCARQLGFDNIPKAGSMERVQAYFDMADQIWEYAKTDTELIKMNQARLSSECYEDPQNHILAEDLVYFINWSYKSAHMSKENKAYAGYWPSVDEYDPGLTAEQYENVFSDEKIIRRDWLDTLYYLYKMGGEGTCKQISVRYGNTFGHYNSNATSVAKKVCAATDCSLFIDEDGRERYWTVLFVGKDAAGGDGSWIWKLRTPVREAIHSMEEKGLLEFNKNLVDYPKNMILYGPPGTGKTYRTVLYAVAIIEGRNLDDVMAEEYDDVKARYDEYVAKDQIAFTTFHQSYGYEEFIEGIKPVMDETTEDEGADVKYTVETGIFKRFCEQAMTPVQVSQALGGDFGFNKTPVVWKVSLDGTGDNPVREECLANGHIRIGWDSYGETITDETDFSVDKGKVVLNAFINKMRVGDVVLSCYSASTIDAIGVVTGEYEWHQEYDRLRRLRKVKWLAKGLSYNVVEMNGGSTMTLATVYKMNVSMADVLRILEEVTTTNNKSELVPNQERYVFIIDEINRGNISKVFGELITLIEPSKRIGQSEELKLLLPYSKKAFGVPNNVYIIGTMNTADRSIALMDTALRRRFHFIEMQPNPDVLAEIDIEGINISEMLRVINKRIEILCDREHTIGHSYFMPLKDTPTLDCLAGIFKNSIIPLLQEYFFDDYEKIRLVLADNQKNEGLQFITRLTVDITSLFGNTDEDIDVEVNYLIHDEVFDKKPEAYIGIYSR